MMQWVQSARRHQRIGWSALLVVVLVMLLSFLLIAPAAADANVPVEINNFAFGTGDINLSGDITVLVDTTVTWTNRDITIHTATNLDGVWDSATLFPSDSYSFTFTTAGTFPYHCVFHAQMHGTITVTVTG